MANRTKKPERPRLRRAERTHFDCGLSKRQMMRSIAWIAAGGIATIAAVSTWADPLLPWLSQDFYPIGVFYQPAQAVGTTSFAGWRGRGVNTLIGWEQQAGNPTPVSIDDYSTAAVNAGMYMIREPRANPGDDVWQPNLLAWLQPDEPDGMGIPAATLQANYDAWHTADPNRPIMVNFDGSRIVGWQGKLTRASYTPYIRAADWVSQDVYPITGFNSPSQLRVVGQAVSTLTSYSAIPDPDPGIPAPPKPTFAFIETSNQRLFSNTFPEWVERGPRPAEFRAEVWDAVIHGARGIFYFPQSFCAFQYDATPIDVAAEMTKQDSIIAGVAPVLNSSDAPDVTTVTFSNGSLECLTKSYGGLTHLIVLNLSQWTVTNPILADFSQ